MKNKFEKGDLVLYLENGEIGKIVDPNSTPNGYWATVMFKNSPEKAIDVTKRRLVSLKELSIALKEVE